MTTPREVALTLALGSEIRAKKHTRRAAKRCAKLMARRLDDLKGAETSNTVYLAGGQPEDVARAAVVLGRLCASCGWCKAWDIKRPARPALAAE